MTTPPAPEIDATVEEIANLCSTLVRCRTTRDRQDEMWRSMAIIGKWWSEAVPADQAAKTLKVWGVEGQGIPLAFFHPRDNARPPVVLHGHLDVVAADELAFKPQRHGDRLMGRGAADMKGAVSVMLHLAAELLPGGAPFGLLLTWNEEEGGRAKSGQGTETFLRELAGYRPAFFLSAERSGLQVAYRSKGMLRMTATVAGRSAHAATPWEGVNALQRLVWGISRLEIPPGSPEGATVSLTYLSAGGGSLNVIPARATIGLDVRFVQRDERDRVLRNLRACLPEAEVTILLDEPGGACQLDNPFLRKLCGALSECHIPPVLFTKPHASDVRLANELGIEGVVFGPDGRNVHGEGEWVSLSSLLRFREILHAFIKSCS
ncbi:MAG: M20/M25/M40 family metallo-hydrolase [Acidobacteriota bacterium]